MGAILSAQQFPHVGTNYDPLGNALLFEEMRKNY